jgi:ABC-2 type transport system ATP-binding protein
VFGEKIAVGGLTLEVRRGEVFGFLGPNGAGKSTSVKMLLGLTRPTSGSATVLGRPIGDRETRSRVGFLPEHFRFYDWLTSAELLRVHGRLYGIPEEALRGRIPALLTTVGLAAHQDKQLRKFSKGMLQRIGIAQALLNDPELIFLDEPTSGLDPVGRRLVRDIIKTQRERGVTVFLNSHLLSEVEVTCDRVAFISAGEVIEVREMSSFSGRQTVIAVRARGLSGEVSRGLSAWVSDIHIDGERLRLAVHSMADAPCILRYLIEKGVEVFEFTPQRHSLEDRFLEILGEDQGL